MQIDLRSQHQTQLSQLSASLSGNSRPLRVKKKTISNLFRYEGRQSQPHRQVDLSDFDQPLHLDQSNQTLEVQGLTTFESITKFTLPASLAPTVTPELKHITIGGAIVGIGIETNSYRYGFVHDSLLEADVLLPDGRILTCSPKNHSNLFFGLPNSYGTLGYVLRAKIQLRPVKPYVTLHTRPYTSSHDLIQAMQQASTDPAVDYIETLAYSPNELYLTTSNETDVPTKLSSIYGPHVFYREISRPGSFCLPTKEFLFRYDPEWFWGLGDQTFYRLFRRLAPRSIRNSSFYARYHQWQRSLPPWLSKGEDSRLEKLIQDWEVPWAQAQPLLDFALKNLDLGGKPLMVAAVKTPARATCYPMLENQLYLNLGSYFYVKRQPHHSPYFHTRLIDDFCFGLGGIKMLYSTTFLSQSQFDQIYAGDHYARLKAKYDPSGLLPTLYQKAVRSH